MAIMEWIMVINQGTIVLKENLLLYLVFLLHTNCNYIQTVLPSINFASKYFGLVLILM